MFIRFVHGLPVRGMASCEGFFVPAYALQANSDLDTFSLAELEELLAWFRQNLKVPPRFNLTKSKNHSRRETKGLSWFKSTAGQHLDKAFELAELLTRHGIEVVLRPTEGAAANLALWRGPGAGADIAIVQGGADERSKAETDEADEGLVSLGSMFYEPV
eukprot:gene6855-8524_t